MTVHVVDDVPDLPGTHRFEVSDTHVWIPGSGGGPDGPTDPDHPAQQRWMRERSGLRECWHLTWEFPDASARRRFLQQIGVDAG